MISAILQDIHTFPDPWPWINNCLEQWSERVFLLSWETSVQLVWRESVKQLSTTPLNSFKRGKSRQRSCIEIQHVKKKVNTCGLFPSPQEHRGVGASRSFLCVCWFSWLWLVRRRKMVNILSSCQQVVVVYFWVLLQVLISVFMS